MSLLKKLALATGILTGLSGVSADFAPRADAQEQTIYRTKDGRLVARDGEQYMLSKIYQARQHQWEENKEKWNNGEKDKATEIPDVLSPRYDVNDFITSMGKTRWNLLTDSQKQRVVNSWNQEERGIRIGTCEAYLNPFHRYAKFLTPQQKTDFERFKKAYESAVLNTDNPALNIFSSRDGSVTRDYTRKLPWIDLNHPTVPDLMMIFMNESVYRNNARLNTDFIQRHSTPAKYSQP